MKFLGLGLTVLGMVLMVQPTAYAYLDPSSATYLFQAVAGVVVASGAAITLYWKKIKLAFKRSKGNSGKNR